MRKLKGILVLVLLLALLASPIAVLASDISGARYYGTIIVSNNSTATTNVAVNCTISTQALIDGDYLNSSANNCVVRSSAGADLPFMPSVNASYPWCIWVLSIGQNSHFADILYTAESTGGKRRYFPGADGMTSSDNDTNFELGDNFTVEQSGWVDTSFSEGDAKLLVDKTGAFSTSISGTENITSLIAGDAWVQKAPQLGAETRIRSLVAYNGKLYGGTGALTGELYEWDDVNLWVQKAPQLGAETTIPSLAVYNDKLYGGTGVLTGELYEWDDVNLWVQKAPQLGAETQIRTLAVYNDKLYGGTGVLTGELYEWDDVNLWVQKAPQLGAETQINALAVYNGKLYGGTGVLTGELYEWDDVNLWVQKAPQLGAETQINALAVYNGKLYGGTSPNGQLLEWNGVNAWELKAPKLGAETDIRSLAVYNGKLYGGTSPNGKLYEWNGVNLWVEVAPQLGAETRIFSLAVYNGKLYGGTGALTGELYEWDSLPVTATGVSSAEHIIQVKGEASANATGYDSSDTVNVAEGIDWLAQTFTIAGDITIYKIVLKLQKIGAPAGNLDYSIRNSVASAPTGIDLVSGNVLASTIGGIALYELTFSEPYDLVAGVYAIVLRVPGGTPGNVIRWFVDSTAPTYGGGNFASSGNSGLTWTPIGTRDASFHILSGGYFAISVDGTVEDVVDIGAISVPNTANDWTYYQNMDDYWHYTDIEIDGVEQQRIEWEYDTVFTDLSGNSHDATPTFRTTSSDSDVSAVLTSFLPISEAKAPGYALEDAPAFIETVPTIVSQWDITPVPGTFPLAGVIAEVANATGTPAQLPLLILAGFVIIACSLTVSATMRRYGSGSLIVKLIVITAVMGIFIAFKNFGVEFWMLSVFLVIAIALAMGSKQVGWQ